MTTESSDAVVACCSALYGNPIAELLVGDSFHPGGLESTRQLLRASGLQPGARLLDIGCGLGASARMAASEFGLLVEAIDPSEAVVDRARARPDSARVRWSTAGLPVLGFEDASFDGVLSECVLSTVDRPVALIEIARVVRPGGMLLISDVEAMGVAIPALGHRIVGTALCIDDAWRPGEMERLIPAAGFRIAQRWDRSRAIVGLADRIEARLSVARIAARDLGLDLAGLLAPSSGDTGPAFTIEAARDALEAVRTAVRDGTLRYTAVVAIRADAP
ncbi:MAG: class I SAM-dependent methyltransferase [Chloroflexota bacterium]|nr:class I SAM-dependent methyltransferase [Chloroflexota bacterium]